MRKVTTWRGTCLLVAVVVVVLVAGIGSGTALAVTDTSGVTERAGSPADHSQVTPDETLVVEKGNPANYDTIQSAVNNATDGDTVEVRPDTYPGSVTIDNKTITLTAPDGATFKESSSAALAGIYIRGSAAPVVSGFTFNGTGYHNGVDAFTSDGGWTLQNVTIINHEQDGVRATDADGDWTIRESTISDNQEDGVDAFGSTGNWTVEETVFTDNEEFSVDAESSSGDWTIQDITDLRNSVDASFSSGNWTVRDTTITTAQLTAGGSEGDWTIRNVSVSNTSFGWAGIFAGASSGDWLIHDTTITDAGGPGVAAAGMGVYDASSGDWTIRNTTIRDSGNNRVSHGVNARGSEGHWTVHNVTIANSTSNGVAAGLSDGDWRILEATITDSGGDGVRAYDSTGAWRVRNTAITDAGDDGVEAIDSKGDWTIRQTSISNSSATGVDASLSAGNWTIRQSDITQSGAMGVDASEAKSNWTIRNATVTDSGSAGIDAREASGDWSIHQSNITDNTQTQFLAAAGVDATDATIQGNATHNWWGDSSGPYHPERNPDGEGDSVTGNVTFEPWLGMDEPEPALFALTEPGVPDTVAVDERFTVSVLVENTGEKEDTQTLTLAIVNTTVSERQEVSLQPGENETVAFETLSITDAGEYTVEIASDDELVSRTVNVSEERGQSCVDVNGDGNCATDTTGDGLLNDIDGDGEFDIFDVQALFSNLGSDAVQNDPEAFNFNGDERPDEVDIFDVQALFNSLEK